MIPIQRIVRSPRRTFALIVEDDGSLVVRAPLRASRAQIEQVVAEKAAWILSRQEAARRAAAEAPGRRFVEGELFLFLGQAYPLQVVEAQRAPLVLDGSALRITRQALPQAARHLEGWYRQQARQVFNQRAAQYAQQHGFCYRQVRLSSARTRWASCGPKGDLNFCWRLVMAPLEVIDYVVLHELVHLAERNHSPRFWSRVESLLPDYRPRRAWLRANAARLRWP
jgi:hypothetical protein